jgi:hypothetical protein
MRLLMDVLRLTAEITGMVQMLLRASVRLTRVDLVQVEVLVGRAGVGLAMVEQVGPQILYLVGVHMVPQQIHFYTDQVAEAGMLLLVVQVQERAVLFGWPFLERLRSMVF